MITHDKFRTKNPKWPPVSYLYFFFMFSEICRYSASSYHSDRNKIQNGRLAVNFFFFFSHYLGIIAKAVKDRWRKNVAEYYLDVVFI